jgi:hypothetical protein
MTGNPLAYFYTTAHVLNHRKYSGFIPIEIPSVPVLWVLNIVGPPKNGWGSQMSWISTNHKKYEIF